MSCQHQDTLTIHWSRQSVGYESWRRLTLSSCCSHGSFFTSLPSATWPYSHVSSRYTLWSVCRLPGILVHHTCYQRIQYQSVSSDPQPSASMVPQSHPENTDISDVKKQHKHIILHAKFFFFGLYRQKTERECMLYDMTWNSYRNKCNKVTLVIVHNTL